MNEGLYLIDIPQADRLGHEAHFSKVAEAFLGYLHDKKYAGMGKREYNI